MVIHLYTRIMDKIKIIKMATIAIIISTYFSSCGGGKKDNTESYRIKSGRSITKNILEVPYLTLIEMQMG